MKRGNLSDYPFSYREDLSLKFSEKNFLLGVKDQDYPDRNIIPILYYDNTKVRDIDDYDMGKILTTPNKNIEMPSLSERFALNQLVKISTGSIIQNERWLEGSPYPKCLTYHTNVHELQDNDVIELFKGNIDESKSRFEITNNALNALIATTYLGTNKNFFIIDNSILIGPFKAIKIDSENQIVIEKGFFTKFGEYSLNEDSFIEFETNGIIRFITIPNFNHLKYKREIDFISDNELIETFKTKFKSNPQEFNQIELEKTIDLISKFSNIKAIDEFIKSNIRLKQIIEKSSKLILSNIDLGKIFPEISETKIEIEKLKDERFNLEKENKSISEKKSTKAQELEEILFKITNSKLDLQNLEKIKSEELQKQKLEIETEVMQLEQRKSQLETEINEEKNRLSSNLEEIIKKIEEKRIIERELDNSIETLKESFVDSQKQAQIQLNELIRHKKHFDFLSGRDISSYDEDKKSLFKNFEIATEEEYKNYETFRSDLSNFLEKNNRKLENHFIDNLLISIHQNTLTLFAGLPGTGKTSLARLLTSMLAPKERVLEISVSRGWTSQKDFIGFYNPLSKKFHSSSTNVYPLLKQLDFERSNSKYLNSPLCYILLDEANLSPIEHYWSTFYNLTDSHASENNYLKINLGQAETIEYANNLRFIGTINYDQTTEELSPRVIDRTNIIQISPKLFEINSQSVNEIKQLQISFSKCQEFFNLLDFSTKNELFPLDIEIDEIYKEIKKLLEGLKIYVSPRVEIAIKRYCNVAKKMMREHNRPLDYCVSQRLLPLINIQGANAKQKLNSLLSLFEKHNLTSSHKILSQIIQCGSDGEIFEDHFNYFLTLSHV